MNSPSDLAACLARLARLEALVEPTDALRERLRMALARADAAEKERDDLRAEVERLRAEVTRAQAEALALLEVEQEERAAAARAEPAGIDDVEVDDDYCVWLLGRVVAWSDREDEARSMANALREALAERGEHAKEPQR